MKPPRRGRKGNAEGLGLGEAVCLHSGCSCVLVFIRFLREGASQGGMKPEVP